MYSEIPVRLLKSHPKNSDYFSALPEEKYLEIKRSIEAHGIRDPLKVLPDYTVVAGHQRLKIALELGLKKVPVVVLDISLEEAEYLLIADNEESRQDNNDPMKKSRRAEFLRQYWGIAWEGQLLNSMADEADAIGENERTAKRLLKLDDRIGPLQDFVSSGELTKAVSCLLALLSQVEQEELLRTLDEKSISQHTETRQKILLEFKRQLEAKNAESRGLRANLESLSQTPIKSIVEIEKVAYQSVPELTKEKEKPKVLQYSEEHMDFRVAMETVWQSAASLTSALARIESNHKNLFLDVSSISNASDCMNTEEAIKMLANKLLFCRFKSAIREAAGKIKRVEEIIEPAKPKPDKTKK